MKEGFRQSMAWLHTWATLSVIWILFFIFVLGTVSYFRVEIDRWMQPERPLEVAGYSQTTAIEQSMERLQSKADGAHRWYIYPTNERRKNHSLHWDLGDDDVTEYMTDASGSETSWISARETGGGYALYRMHFSLHYMPIITAYWIVTLCTMFMLVGIISGVIIHKKIFKDFFTFRPQKKQRTWLDMHNVLSVMALPFHFMITYSGLLFFMFTVFAGPIVALYGVNQDAINAAVEEIFPGRIQGPEETGIKAPMAPIGPMLEQVREHWGQENLNSIRVDHPGDETARVTFRHINNQVVTDNSSHTQLIFDGVTGEMLTPLEPTPYSAVVATSRTFMSLHMGLFSGPVLRWIYFLSGVVGTAMVATGMVLWTVKRRTKQEKSPEGVSRGLRFVEKMNVGTIVGLPTGIAVYFIANRLIDPDLVTRVEWEKHSLFITWGIALAYATFRATPKAWVETLVAGAVIYALVPVINFLTSDFHLINTISAGQWDLAGLDLTCLACSGLMAYMAQRVQATYQKAVTAPARPRRRSVAKPAQVLEAAE